MNRREFGKKVITGTADKYKMIVQDGAEQRSNPCAQSMTDSLLPRQYRDPFVVPDKV